MRAIGRFRGLFVLVLSLVLLMPSASRATGIETGFADPLYGSGDSAERALWLDRTVESRAGIVRVLVQWRTVAPQRPAKPADPADPAYDFSRIDTIVSGAAARGLEPLLTVYAAPAWAEGPGRPSSAAAGSWRPDPASLADFGEALATRYSGRFAPAGQAGLLPRVRYFQSWNEPNLEIYLSPAWEGRKLASTEHYRRMLNAFDAAIKGVGRGNRHVTAGLAPYGDERGGTRVRPLVFWRGLLCLNRRLKRACKAKSNFDVFGEHAITTSGTPRTSALDPDDMSTADLGKARKLLGAAERAATAPGRHPIWVTEFWWESDPPAERSGVPLRKQAAYIAETIYLAWRAGAEAAIGLQIRDSPPSGTKFERNGAGIYFVNGKPKPSARSFRFPFVADRRARSVLLWAKPPAGRKLTVERKVGGSWRKLTALEVGKNGIATGSARVRAGTKLRVKAAGETSLSWKVGR